MLKPGSIRRWSPADLLWAAIGLVLAGLAAAQSYSAFATRNADSAFASAPTCQASISTAEDCKSWQDLTVTSATSRTVKGNTTYTITAGGHTVFFRAGAPDWIAHIAAGQQVEMLVWQGNPEALRGASGEVEYTADAALTAYFDHLGAAGLCLGADFFAALGYLLVSGLPRKRGNRRLTTYTGLATAGFAVLAAACVAGLGAARASLVGLAAAPCFAGCVLLAVALVARLRRRRRRVNAKVLA